VAQRVAVWDALVSACRITALVRNLGKMTATGLVKPFSEAAEFVVASLATQPRSSAPASTPWRSLIAQKVLPKPRREGQSDLAAGLEDRGCPGCSFLRHVSRTLKPCGKPVLLALDVSGSMERLR